MIELFVSNYVYRNANFIENTYAHLLVLYITIGENPECLIKSGNIRMGYTIKINHLSINRKAD